MVHELVGHAATLIHPGMAAVNRMMGAVAREASASEMARVENVYWYTMEFGTALQDNEVVAVGAGLLSSVAELEQMRTQPKLLDWDLNRIAATPYDPTDLQPQLFVAPSFTRMLSDIEAWISGSLARFFDVLRVWYCDHLYGFGDAHAVFVGNVHGELKVVVCQQFRRSISVSCFQRADV